MGKLCICGNPNCDSLFHKGDKVEVKWGDQWISGEVTVDMRSHVNVKLLHPIFYVEKKVTKIIVKSFWGREEVLITEKLKHKILNEITFGVAYVSFPDGKGWERPEP